MQTAAILEAGGVRRQHRQRNGACSALIDMVFREAIERDALDLLALAGRAAAETGHDPLDGALHRDLAALGNDYLAQERHLEMAALALRQAG